VDGAAGASVILVGPNLETLPTIATGTVQMVATSPPYFGLRRYGDSAAEMGAEPSLDAYVSGLVAVMRECRRVLRDDGCAWVNLGDSYANDSKWGGYTGGKHAKGLHGGESGIGRERRDTGAADGNALLVPFRVASALQADGWTLRAMLPWVKLASMPESVQSRPSMAHEYVLFLTKRPSGYFYDADAVRVGNSPSTLQRFGDESARKRPDFMGGVGTSRSSADGSGQTCGVNPAGRSYRSSDTWRAGAREAAAQLLAAADGTAIGMLTNDDAPAALVVNPKGSGIQHFAMWPTRLVAPMIMAGTPEAGSCSVCGAPWARVVERVGGPPRGDHRKKAGMRDNPQGSVAAGSVYGGDLSKLYAKHGYPETRTLGFRPSCEHADAPARPAIVLDPFVGAGTTIGIAEALGREAIGCELYQANADLLPARTAIVRGEMADYLKGRGEKVAHVEEDGAALGPLFGGL
jgi:DNA modification methylase